MQLYDEDYHDTRAEFQALWDLLVESYALTASPDNWLFDRLSIGYGALTRRMIRLPVLLLLIYGGLLAATGWTVTVVQFPE